MSHIVCIFVMLQIPLMLHGVLYYACINKFEKNVEVCVCDKVTHGNHREPMVGLFMNSWCCRYVLIGSVTTQKVWSSSRIPTWQKSTWELEQIWKVRRQFIGVKKVPSRIGHMQQCWSTIMESLGLYRHGASSTQRWSYLWVLWSTSSGCQ